MLGGGAAERERESQISSFWLILVNVLIEKILYSKGLFISTWGLCQATWSLSMGLPHSALIIYLDLLFVFAVGRPGD